MRASRMIKAFVDPHFCCNPGSAWAEYFFAPGFRLAASKFHQARPEL